ncbi:MAG: sugar ABC transporter ATP-binding protein, partial [Bacillota bacterium]
VGTKVDIYRLIKRLAEDGIGIILISSELNEVKKCSNRIISLYDGKIAGEHDQNADKEEILSAMFGLNKEKNGGHLR